MKPFGYSCLYDAWGCLPGSCDDLELHYRFLETLVIKLGMTPMSAPFVIHAPRNTFGEELFPDKAGVSGWVPLIESGIQIHSLEPTNFMTLDVYSCKPFDVDIVRAAVKEAFQPSLETVQFLVRGDFNSSVKLN